MKTYTQASEEVSRSITRAYSTSFTMTIKLLPADQRQHIYNIYALVRIADEIVDTYRGEDAPRLLDELEAEAYGAVERGYSTNPVVHAFADTAKQYGIDKDLLAPFFASMRMDLTKHEYTRPEFKAYIHGSAEVVGLMCLKVFTGHNDAEYERLQSGARALGAAFQKVNFLRDIAEDHARLGRSYFPGVTLENLNQQSLARITYEIREDFAAALPDINQLPEASRPAVFSAYHYSLKLLNAIEHAPLDKLKGPGIRLNKAEKIRILVLSAAREKLRRKRKTT
jgi:15-cis-phytoene synthase